jgi:hypothetical protein
MCCGKSRAQFQRRIPGPPLPSPFATPSPRPPLARFPGVAFEYVGRTGLTVAGPVTGQEYRFDRPGSRVEVDPRDRPSIAAIPLLRQVR